MKQKEKRQRALKVLDHFVDCMGYWEEVSILADGLTEEEMEEVNQEVAKIAESIRNRYQLGKIWQ